MLRKLFEKKLYVKVSRNRFEIINLSEDQVAEIVSSPEPFSTSRLLIGEFSRAKDELQKGIQRALPKRLVKWSTAILIHPIEMTEGGLSEVEVRILREIGFGTGAHKVEIWEGEELSADQAADKLEDA